MLRARAEELTVASDHAADKAKDAGVLLREHTERLTAAAEAAEERTGTIREMLTRGAAEISDTSEAAANRTKEITAALRHQADQATQRLRQTFATHAEATGNMADRTGQRPDHITASLARTPAARYQAPEP